MLFAERVRTEIAPKWSGRMDLVTPSGHAVWTPDHSIGAEQRLGDSGPIRWLPLQRVIVHEMGRLCPVHKCQVTAYGISALEQDWTLLQKHWWHSLHYTGHLSRLWLGPPFGPDSIMRCEPVGLQKDGAISLADSIGVPGRGAGLPNLFPLGHVINTGHSSSLVAITGHLDSDFNQALS